MCLGETDVVRTFKHLVKMRLIGFQSALNASCMYVFTLNLFEIG